MERIQSTFTKQRPRHWLASALVMFGACSIGDSARGQDSIGGLLNQFRETQAVQPAAAMCSVNIAPERELLIRHLGVVEDPVRTRWTGATANPADGAWTFGRLMQAMAGSGDPSAFVLAWLRHWETPQTINGFTVPARPAINQLVINPWLQRSGGTQLDLTKAPFRLLAIVNRLDLRDGYGRGGEGRFVFGVLDDSGSPTPFTVILEYALPISNAGDVDRWAAQWHALSDLSPGSSAYNAALQTITDRFTAKGAARGRINSSAISQVRSNEIALDRPWQLREFRLNATGQLVQTTTAQTPANSLGKNNALANFINDNEKALLAGTHTVPLTVPLSAATDTPMVPFKGASSEAPGLFTAAGIKNSQARFVLSVNTCTGCHSFETGTTFLHVSPRSSGTQTTLSGFMTGTSVTDPVSGVTRPFNDIQNRSTDLKNLICASVPTTAITSPISGAYLKGGSYVKLTASANDNVGVKRVDFFDGLRLIGSSTVSPYSVAWQVPQVQGWRILSSKAIDNNGLEGVSTGIKVQVFPTCPYGAVCPN